MYAGSTLRQLRNFDTWFGAHQKIDRIARRKLSEIISAQQNQAFPTAKQLLRFEGLDGPDGIKRKTPAQDEPWHYYNPDDPNDTKLAAIIDTHHRELVAAIREGNKTRISFESAWIAHAVVDGLTPAHHYPYEEELVRLRKGASIETRTTPKEKLIMPGDTLLEKLRNNWEMWGDKGLLSTHFAFEWGVALIIFPLRASRFVVSRSAARTVWRQQDIAAYFQSQAQAVSRLGLYEAFYKSGWTPQLAQRVRKELMSIIVETVTVVWYTAVQEAKAKK